MSRRPAPFDQFLALFADHCERLCGVEETACASSVELALQTRGERSGSIRWSFGPAGGP